MSTHFIEQLFLLCEQQPAAIALTDGEHTVCFGELKSAITQHTQVLQNIPSRAMGLAIDNAPLWALLDLAALKAGKIMIPLPFFFSPEQIAHSIRDAGISCILTDAPQRYREILAASGINIAAIISGNEYTEIRLSDIEGKELPEGTVKITYTSGTTGHPKGVCLSESALYQVATSLLEATGGTSADHHLSVLPLSTLLENLAGVYVPLLAGATCHLPRLADVGLSGSSGLDIQKMLGALIRCQATTTILTPQLLHAMVAAIEAGHPRPEQLRFVAIGGATVAERLLHRAKRAGIPVFEGYGLSECSSVVSLNTETDNLIGSVGKPLPHVKLKFAEDGEILVSGATLLGYTGGEPFAVGDFWPTGDIGYLDQAGFLHLTGRKKNIFITSFGRNVSPEWVERELTLHPAIAQAAVFGEARPWNTAVIVARGQVSKEVIDQAIQDANLVLPDYAQVKCWLPAKAPFMPHNGQLTANGRLKREAIRDEYQAEIAKFYL